MTKRTRSPPARSKPGRQEPLLSDSFVSFVSSWSKPTRRGATAGKSDKTRPEPAKTDAPDDPTLFVFFNEIGIIEQLARNRFERVLPERLTLAQFGVLNNFVRLGGTRGPARLARAFQVTKGAMTNTLKRLEAKGFVATRPDPRDGRAKIVTITDEGRAARARALDALAPELERLTRTFPEGQFAAAIPFLAELRAHLDKARDAG